MTFFTAYSSACTPEWLVMVGWVHWAAQTQSPVTCVQQIARPCREIRNSYFRAFLLVFILNSLYRLFDIFIVQASYLWNSNRKFKFECEYFRLLSSSSIVFWRNSTQEYWRMLIRNENLCVFKKAVNSVLVMSHGESVCSRWCCGQQAVVTCARSSSSSRFCSVCLQILQHWISWWRHPRKSAAPDSSWTWQHSSIRIPRVPRLVLM